MPVDAITAYDDALTLRYSEMFGAESRVSWLIRALEDFVFGVVPCWNGLSVLDVPCGVGSYCRRVAGAGAVEVVGVDISESQIAYCRGFKERLGSDLYFIQEDVRNLFGREEFRHRFDVVNSSWLYDLASCSEDLALMTRAIAWCLKPDGLHTGVDLNFHIRASSDEEWRDYGIGLMEDRPSGYQPVNGELITGRVAMGTQRPGASVREQDFSGDRDGGTLLRVCYYDKETYLRAFRASGFRSVDFINPKDWPVSSFRLSSEERALFVRYCHSNPEMIGFIARL